LTHSFNLLTVWVDDLLGHLTNHRALAEFKSVANVDCRKEDSLLSQTKLGYSVVQRWSHWIIVILCLASYPTAEAIRTSHIGHVFGVKGTELVQIKASIHEWGGWMALALVLVMALSRLVQGIPDLPQGMAKWQRWLAHFTHFAIYAALVALAASGAAAMYIGGTYGQMHVTLARIGVALITLHLLGVFWHQVIQRDRLLSRMWPILPRR
jgi:cytochrome b561